ncbi:hypothetical protein DL96DRAFT_1562328 [Flagelloscypha sp. PMI_526]|nr:hypothetical protein DL96DRAFT_1562328 [Flagelloscypha sp. PMI_526]
MQDNVEDDDRSQCDATRDEEDSGSAWTWNKTSKRALIRGRSYEETQRGDETYLNVRLDALNVQNERVWIMDVAVFDCSRAWLEVARRRCHRREQWGEMRRVEHEVLQMSLAQRYILWDVAVSPISYPNNFAFNGTSVKGETDDNYVLLKGTEKMFRRERCIRMRRDVKVYENNEWEGRGTTGHLTSRSVRLIPSHRLVNYMENNQTTH